MRAQVGSAPGRSGEPRLVTFSRDVAPILFAHCIVCHRSGGGAPMALLTYADVRPRARQIAEAAARRVMPPWKPDPGVVRFAGERRLAQQDIDRLQQWVRDGSTQGDPRDLPPHTPFPPGWQLGTPDLVLEMPEPYSLLSSGVDVFRTFVLPVRTITARYVRALEFQPGDSAAIHHANLKIDRTRASRHLDERDPGPGFAGGAGRDARFPSGQFLGWTPGQVARVFEPAAWRLDADSDLVVELHLVPSGRPEPVQIRIGLYFGSEPREEPLPYMIRLGRQDLDIPAGQRDYVSVDRYTLPVAVDLLSLQPHAHKLARQIEATATLPSGAVTPLIAIKDWDFHWQEVYRLAEPMPLPAGTALTMTYTYDNSASNRGNPNMPPRRVTFGQTTASEMGDLWLQVRTRTRDDRERLDRDYASKMLHDDLAGAEKTLSSEPRDPRLHMDLAFCLIDANRVPEAIAHLREAVRLDPNSPYTHYELGTALLRQRAHAAAAAEFREAVHSKPDFSEAYNNLGTAQYEQGDHGGAIASYRQAVAAQLDNAEAHYNLGRALHDERRDDEAEREYALALATRPDDPVFRAGFGQFLASRNRADAAIVEYRHALSADPNLVPALVDLAWILATSARPGVRSPAEAVQLAERAAALTRRESPVALDTLAAAYHAIGRRDEAVSTAKAAAAVAAALGETELAAAIRQRLDRYAEMPQEPAR
jgi:tetratricopeptide (TPR) repeat protein